MKSIVFFVAYKKLTKAHKRVTSPFKKPQYYVRTKIVRKNVIEARATRTLKGEWVLNTLAIYDL